MCSIEKEAMRHKKRPVVLAVPVNLRSYFPLGAPQFFSVIRRATISKKPEPAGRCDRQPARYL
ncbi:MAG: hypothetical protein ACLS8R_00185 [Anaeromassilibacillus sp.]